MLLGINYVEYKPRREFFMRFDKNGKPDYETWLKMKELEEGTHPNQSLYDAVDKTLDKMFEGVKPSYGEWLEKTKKD